MFIDRCNRHVYVPCSEMDREALLAWSQQEPRVHSVDLVLSAHMNLKDFTFCLLTRTDEERRCLWAHALLHSDEGRRISNRFGITSYTHAQSTFSRYPHLLQSLRDFQDSDKSDLQIPVSNFKSYTKNFGYTCLPSFINTKELRSVEFPKVNGASPQTDLRVPIFYINVDGHTERRAKIEKGLATAHWSASRISATTPDNIAESAIVSRDYPDLARGKQIEQALSISHLRALEAFVATKSAWGLILEDDIDLSCTKQWNFKLSDLPHVIPSNCGILQLSQIWPILKVESQKVQLSAPPDLKIQAYTPGRNWGTGSYLVRREYALDVLAFFAESNKFSLSRYPGAPTADVWLYDHLMFSPLYKAYSVVLLTCQDVPSTLGHPSSHDSMHRFSRLYALQLLRTGGKKVELAEVFTPVEAKDYPFVSILTPSYNRRHLLPLLEQCILAQNYPRCRMEWIVVDDSQDDRPLFQAKDGTGLTTRYVVLPEKLALGAKRNHTSALSRGNICVFMDDDDYYGPTRVSHAVDMLQKHPHVHVAGSTYLPIFFVNLNELYLAGPWHAHHTMGGALAHRRLLLETQRFTDTATHAEEPSFLNGFTLPLVQLDIWQTIVCLAHESNTFDKKKLFGNSKLNKSDKIIKSVIPSQLLSQYHEVHKKT